MALLLSLVFLAAPRLTLPPPGLTEEAWGVLGVFAACMVLWITSAIPTAATGLLALAALPLWGDLPAQEVFSYFGNRTVFFLISAFLIAAAMRETGLSIRLALWFFRRFGRTPKGLVTAVLILGFCMSCFMPEHAVAAMMFPILVELMDALRSRKSGEDIKRFGVQLFLAMVWGVVIGGIVTLLGGARNPLAISIMEEATGYNIGFKEWMSYSLPMALPALGIALLLIRYSFKVWPSDISYVRIILDRKRRDLGPMKSREKMTGLVIACTIAGWMLLGEKSDMAVIGLFGTQVLFFLNLVSFEGIQKRVDWAVIFLYGGAIALGKAMVDSGAADWLASHILSGDLTPVTQLAVIGAFVLVSTEAISNAAVVTLILPVILGELTNLGLDPRIVTVAVALPSGMVFSLPIGTPAMAIAFSSGYLTVGDTLKRGIILSAASYGFFLICLYFIW